MPMAMTQKPPAMTAEQLQELLRARGWTQTELATAIGYSFRQVNRLYNGKAPITRAAADLIRQTLKGK